MSTWSNGSGLTSISHRHGLQTITTSCRYFCWKLCHYRGPHIHPWDSDLSWSTPQGDGEHLRDARGCPPPWPPPYEASKGVHAKLETQSMWSSSQSRALGAVCSKTDTEVTNGLCFWRSTYGWKAILISQPMAVVPYQNSFRINRNHRNNLTSEIYQGAALPSFGLFGPCNVSDFLGTRIEVLGHPLGYKISSRFLR